MERRAIVLTFTLMCLLCRSVHTQCPSDCAGERLRTIMVLLFISLRFISPTFQGVWAERSSQAVELKFYQIQTSEWNDKGHSSKVAVQVSAAATAYCNSNPALCGMAECCSTNTTFKDTNVGIVSGFPEDDRNDLKLKIYLDLPAGANATGTLQCVVGKGVLQTIVGNARDIIHTETGSWITYIDDIFYGIPPASELNRILIPLAFVILFLICLSAVILHFWNKRQEDLDRKRKIIEKRKATQKMKKDPKYDVDTSEPKSPAGVTGKNKDELYRQRLRQRHSNQSEKKPNMAINDEVSVNPEPQYRNVQALSKKLESEPVKVQGATNYGFDHKNEVITEKEPIKEPISEPTKPPAHLAPISVDADTEEPVHTEKEKKKKKKKKHKSKSGEVTNVTDIGNGSAVDH